MVESIRKCRRKNVERYNNLLTVDGTMNLRIRDAVNASAIRGRWRS